MEANYTFNPLRRLFMSKISKLKSQVSKLEKAKESARVKVHYHKEKMEEAVKGNKAEAYVKHNLKAEFYNKRLGQLQTELDVAKAELGKVEYDANEKEFQKGLKIVKIELADRLTSIRDAILNKEYEEAFNQSQDFEEVVASHIPQFGRGLKDFTSYYKPQSTVLMLSTIISKRADIVKASAVRGEVIARGVEGGKFSAYVKNVVGILNSAIKMLEK